MVGEEERDGSAAEREALAADEGASSIKVAVRVRPLSAREKAASIASVIRVIEGQTVVVLDPADGAIAYGPGANRTREKQYSFDHAFDDSTSQEEVFNLTTRDLVDYVLRGLNCTAFAYGPTGSGKTHTMTGTADEPGVMPRTLERLFERMRAQTANTFRVRISYIEVYNECVYDLLRPSGAAGGGGAAHGNGANAFGGLDLREDPVKGMFVAGVHEEEVTEPSAVLAQLERGNARRTTEATRANATSSRSHAVLQILIESREALANVQTSLELGKLSLIDLAGSERMGKTNNAGARLREGNKINQSLLALANCINALGDKAKRGQFVNYRDSKLTRLLKESLGGNSKTVMLCCLAPSADAFEETTSTLKYAHRAKNIKTKAVRNSTSVTAHIAEYQQIISDLRTEIGNLRDQLQHVSAMEPPSLPHSPDLNATLARRAALRSAGVLRASHEPSRSLSRAAAHSSHGGAAGGAADGDGTPDGAAADATDDAREHAHDGGAPGDGPRVAVLVPDSDGDGADGSDDRELDEDEQALADEALLSGTQHIQMVQAELVSNFQERLQLRRSLVELTETSRQNRTELAALAELAEQLRAGAAGAADGGDAGAAEALQSNAELLRVESETTMLLTNEAANEELRATLGARLRDNESTSRAMYARLPQSVTSEGLRQFLRLLSSNQMMELEVLQLQLQLRMREQLEGAMLAQLSLRDSAIAALTAALHNAQIPVPHAAAVAIEQLLPPHELRVAAVAAVEADAAPLAAFAQHDGVERADHGARAAAAGAGAPRGAASRADSVVADGVLGAVASLPPLPPRPPPSAGAAGPASAAVACAPPLHRRPSAAAPAAAPSAGDDGGPVGVGTAASALGAAASVPTLPAIAPRRPIAPPAAHMQAGTAAPNATVLASANCMLSCAPLDTCGGAAPQPQPHAGAGGPVAAAATQCAGPGARQPSDSLLDRLLHAGAGLVGARGGGVGKRRMSSQPAIRTECSACRCAESAAGAGGAAADGEAIMMAPVPPAGPKPPRPPSQRDLSAAARRPTNDSGAASSKSHSAPASPSRGTARIARRASGVRLRDGSAEPAEPAALAHVAGANVADAADAATARTGAADTSVHTSGALTARGARARGGSSGGLLAPLVGLGRHAIAGDLPR